MSTGQWLVGAFATGAKIWDRLGTEIVISTEHADFMIYNKILIRAEKRLAFAVRNSAAFVTGSYPS